MVIVIYRKDDIMDISALVNEIKKEGYKEPKIGIVTPEIRTIDERVQVTNVKFLDSADEQEQQ